MPKQFLLSGFIIASLYISWLDRKLCRIIKLIEIVLILRELVPLGPNWEAQGCPRATNRRARHPRKEASRRRKGRARAKRSRRRSQEEGRRRKEEECPCRHVHGFRRCRSATTEPKGQGTLVVHWLYIGCTLIVHKYKLAYISVHKLFFSVH